MCPFRRKVETEDDTAPERPLISKWSLSKWNGGQNRQHIIRISRSYFLSTDHTCDTTRLMKVANVKEFIDTTQDIEVTKEDLERARRRLVAAPSTSVEEAIIHCKYELDQFCKTFVASSYQELMSRADMGEFPPEVCFDILNHYSFLSRHSS